MHEITTYRIQKKKQSNSTKIKSTFEGSQLALAEKLMKMANLEMKAKVFSVVSNNFYSQDLLALYLNHQLLTSQEAAVSGETNQAYDTYRTDKQLAE